MVWILIRSLCLYILMLRELSFYVKGQETKPTLVATLLKTNTVTGIDIVKLQFSRNEYSGVTFNFSYGLRFTLAETGFDSVHYDGFRHNLYLHDIVDNSIYEIPGFSIAANQTAYNIHRGTSRTLVKIAYDWVSNNLYWTDQLYKWIGVKSLAKSDEFYATIVQDNVNVPAGIAVDPIHGYLFWTDAGSTPRIERSRLDGSERTTLISQGILYSTAIAVDTRREIFVWVDSLRDTIEMANFDGSHRRIIRRYSHTELFDIALYESLVFVTDQFSGKMHVVEMSSGEELETDFPTYQDKLLGVSIYDPNSRETTTDYCGGSSCSDICVNVNGDAKCICRMGFVLDSTGTNCIEDTGSFHRALVYSNSSSICLTNIRAINNVEYYGDSSCIHIGANMINLIDINSHTREVIYVDMSDNISMLNLDSRTTPTRLTTATNTVTGLCVDWRDENIYWAQGSSSGQINLLSKTAVYPLITANLHNPQSLALVPLQNFMLWVSGTAPSYKIERANLDGTERKAISSTSLAHAPNYISVDRTDNVFYYVADGTVRTCDFDGIKCDIVLSDDGLLRPTLLLVYKNHLVVYDSTEKELVSYKKTDLTTRRARQTMDGLTDIKVLDEDLQPLRHGPCDVMNGNCGQICIPADLNRICRCEYGYQLDDNRQTCSSDPIEDKFLVVTDWTHNKLYQVSLTNGVISAIDSALIQSPNGVACDPMHGKIIWGDTDDKRIQSVDISGSGYIILAQLDQYSSHPDRLALDSETGDIYYTAVGTSTGFTGVGVVRATSGSNIQLVRFGKDPRAIQLDRNGNVMFWTDHGTSPPVLMKANLDGTNIQTINEDMKWPNGLAIDNEARILYLTDGYTDRIYKCTYSGGCSLFHTDLGAHLMDIQFYRNYLYYTAWNRPFITRIHKQDTSDVSRLASNAELGRLDGICIYDTDLVSATKKPKTKADPQNKDDEDETSVGMPVIAGAIVGGLVLIAVIVVVVVCLVRRHGNGKNSGPTSQTAGIVNPIPTVENKMFDSESPVYDEIGQSTLYSSYQQQSTYLQPRGENSYTHFGASYATQIGNVPFPGSSSGYGLGSAMYDSIIVNTTAPPLDDDGYVTPSAPVLTSNS